MLMVQYRIEVPNRMPKYGEFRIKPNVKYIKTKTDYVEAKK